MGRFLEPWREKYCVPGTCPELANFNMPGGGMERVVVGSVPAKVVEVHP
jgi:hypothetical protein